MPAVLYAMETGAGLIDEVTNFRVRKDLARSIHNADGGIEPNLISLDQGDPMVEFESLAIARALGIVGMDGLAVPGDPDFADLFFQEMELEGTRVAGAGHLRGRVGAGMFIPDRIRAEQGRPATYAIGLHARYDLAVDPIVWAPATALAGTPVFDQLFTLGPVFINGVQLPHVQSVEIVCGLNLEKIHADGHVWPIWMGIRDRNTASIRIRTKYAVAQQVYGLAGTAQGVTDSVVYLRAKSPDGAGNIANATTAHISFTIDAGNIVAEDSNAQHPSPFDTDVVITPRWDGTNPVLAVATGVALP